MTHTPEHTKALKAEPTGPHDPQPTAPGQHAPRHLKDAEKHAERALNPSAPANTGTTPGSNAKVG